MKYSSLPNFKTLLMAGGLLAITLPLLNSCKSTSKTASNKIMNSSSSMKTTSSLSDTAMMTSDTTGGGKQTNGDKDKKP